MESTEHGAYKIDANQVEGNHIKIKLMPTS